MLLADREINVIELKELGKFPSLQTSRTGELRTKITNSRPISLLPILSKVVEKLSKKILNYLQKFDLMTIWVPGIKRYS